MRSSRRLLVVSHPGVVPVNLSVYVPLVDWGWDLTVVVPDRWRHEYSARPGRPSRHAYLAGGIGD